MLIFVINFKYIYFSKSEVNQNDGPPDFPKKKPPIFQIKGSILQPTKNLVSRPAAVTGRYISSKAIDISIKFYYRIFLYNVR
jgi:hypothetical protein